MNGLKYTFLLLLGFVLFSCKNEQKETIESKIRQINGMIVIFQDRIEKRGVEIANISTLSLEKKVEYRYDSLVQVQGLMINAVKVFQHQVDSLKGALDHLK